MPPEGDRLLVTSEHGFLTVVAQEADLDQVLQAITSRSGSPIILVNPPADPPTVTITIERQPLPQALPHLLEALRRSMALAYMIVYAQDRLPWVKIFFLETSPGPGGSGEPPQESLRAGGEPIAEELPPRSGGEPIAEELPPLDAAQEEIAAAVPTEEKDNQEVIEVLQELGVATERLDAEQLFELKLRLAQGLLVPEGLQHND